MTETSQHPRPVPNAAQFQPRPAPVVRPRSAPAVPVVWTTLPDWAELDAEELAALPPNSRRTLEAAPGLYVNLVKGPMGTWTLMNRQGISSRALAGARTAPRVPIDPDNVGES